MVTEAFAPAKVNLALHVTGRRDDGYHLLDSIVVFADVGDRVTLTPADSLSLQVTGPMAAGVPVDPSNLCWRAAVPFDHPVTIALDKHLPAAAGIGGGSSDAAAVIRGMQAVTGRGFPGDPMALGADVPVCLMARAARMRGVGEDVAALDGLPPLPAVLVNPGVAVPTGPVFAAMTRRDNPGLPPLPQAPGPEALIAWLRGCRNDLEPPALQVQPVIAGVLEDLAALPGARLARMSGSGATCFALFDALSGAQDAAARLSVRRPGWWVRACTLR